MLGYPRPDARVDPQGRMLRSLAARAAPRPRAAAAEPGWLEGLGRMAGSAWSGLESLLQGWRTEDRAQTRRTAQASRPAARRSAGGAGGVISDAEYERVARRLGPKVDPLLVRALAEKESGGKSGFAADGRIIIAFEGHKFWKHTGRIYDRSHPKLS